MEDCDYRRSIIEAISIIEEMEDRLFTSMINIGMYGVHKDIHQSFELGDVFNFELSMFENTGDINLNLITQLIKQTVACKSRLMNLNAIDSEEKE